MGHVDDLMCVGPRSALDIFAKLECVYEFTSTFLGPDAGKEREGKFLGRSVCGRTECWSKKMLDEWDLYEAKEIETLGMTDEYDVWSFLSAGLPLSTEEQQPN